MQVIEVNAGKYCVLWNNWYTGGQQTKEGNEHRVGDAPTTVHR